MKKHLIIKHLFLIILLFFLVSPLMSFSSELQLNYPSIPGRPELTPSLDMNLSELVGWFYYFIIGIAGLASFVSIVMGGFQWLTSTGNPTKISDAKDMITSALLGLIIILLSYLILTTINPQLIELNLL